MTSEEARQLLASVGSLLSQMMRLHDMAVGLTAGAQTPQYRVDRLFARQVTGTATTHIQPYRQEAPGIAFGLEDGHASSILLRETARNAGYNQIQIEVEKIGVSRWLTLEIDMPWPAIRAGDYLDLTISASVSKELSCSVRLAALDFDKNRIDLGWTWMTLPKIRKPAMVKLNYGLADDRLIDFDQEPKLVIFFPVEQFVLDLDYIELTAGS